MLDNIAERAKKFKHLDPGPTRVIHVTKVTMGPWADTRITVVREDVHGAKGYAFLGLLIQGPSRMVFDPNGLPFTGTRLYLETESPIEGEMLDLVGSEADAFQDQIELRYHCGWGAGASG